MCFFGTFIPAQLICLLFKEVKLEQKHVLDLSEKRIRFLTYFDVLTGLPNRKLAESLILPALEDSGFCSRTVRLRCLILMISKLINEIHGPKTG